jgi:hypothetical protein
MKTHPQPAVNLDEQTLINCGLSPHTTLWVIMTSTKPSLTNVGQKKR